MTTLRFNRPEVFELLSKRVEGFRSGYRQNVALLGPEGMGKTALLRRFLQENAARDSSLVCLYLRLDEEDNLVEWANRFIQTLLYAVLQAEGSQELPTQISELLRHCASCVPKTASSAGKALLLAEAGKSEEAYDRVWDLPLLLAQETGYKTVLVLDEFQRLAFLPVKDSFRSLGRKIMVQNTTLYLLVSSQSAASRSILREGLSLLFGQFEIVELGPLGESACLQAIREGAVLPEKDPLMEHLLVQLVQGHPGRLDLFLKGLKGRLQEGLGAKSLQPIFELLGELFLDGESALRQEFEARLRRLPSHRMRLFFVQVLAAVSSGLHRPAAIAQRLGRSSSQVLQALQILEQKELVCKQGMFYCILDHLFRLWMSTAYPVLHGVGFVDAERARGYFHEAAQGWFTQISKSIRQPLRLRVLELLERWGGEQVEMEGRRIRLPRFARIDPVAIPQGPEGIVAWRREKGISGWLVIPWAGRLEERDARILVQAVRGMSTYKAYRKVVLGPSPVEVHARLILQQAKLRLWDLSVLNTLLDLYGLPMAPVPSDSFSEGTAQTVSVGSEAQRPASDQISQEAG